MMDTLKGYIPLISRILLGLIFVLAGFGKLMDPAGNAAYVQMGGLPGFMVWPAMALELLGGIALIVGFQTRLAALALAGFSLLAAVLYHNNFADQVQMIMFLKNLAIAGGLLQLYLHGAGKMAVDKA
jgi:putative oxidoreductase